MFRVRLVSSIFLISLFLTAPPVMSQDIRTSVRTALSSNPSVRAKDAAVRSAAYELLEMRGAYEPTVTAFGSLVPEYVDDPGGLSLADNARSKNSREVGFVVELPVFDGYRRANTVYVRAARLDRTMFEYLDASETMALTVVQAHIDVARNRALLATAQDQLARHLEISDKVSNQVSGGRLPLSDQLQSEARVEAVRITIGEISRELQNAEWRFQELVGSLPKSNLAVPPVPAIPQSLDVLVRTSIANNFRVKGAQAHVDARKFERGVSESEYLPQVSLNAGSSYGADLDGASGEETRAFIGFNLTWQLYSGGRNERRRALVERQNEALYDRMAIARQVQQMAETAWTSFHSNQRISGLASKQVSLNRDLVAQYLVEFELATRSLLDVLIAETELFHARVQQVNSNAAVVMSAYRMLGAQSQLARYFGIDSTGEVLALQVGATQSQKPFNVIDKALPVVNR